MLILRVAVLYILRPYIDKYQEINKTLTMRLEDFFMRFSRVLLAVTTAVSMSSAFADIHTTFVSAGSEESAQISEESSITLTNADAAKYTSSSSYSFSGNNTSWMSHMPVVNARSTSGWGVRTLMGTTRHHSGVDLAAPTGTPIYATGPGIVTKSGWGSGYGQYIDIDHGNGYTTRYAHASRLIARVGQKVKAGEHIANVGCTGRCTGPHLHFEVVKNGTRQNPSTYLAMIPKN